MVPKCIKLSVKGPCVYNLSITLSVKGPCLLSMVPEYNTLCERSVYMVPEYNTFCERSVSIQQSSDAATRHPLFEHVDVAPLLQSGQQLTHADKGMTV